MITRTDYMKASNAESHHAYYVQAVTPALIKRVVARIGADRITKSADRYFNDLRVPIDNWRDTVTLQECADFNELTTGQRVTSDSDRICIAKAAAREWRNAEKGTA